MSTKKKSGAEEPRVPGPDTFDFDDYISGASTFPEFSHTAYLDQASGIALVEAADEYEELTKRAKEIQRRQRVINETIARSLVDEEMEELEEEFAGVEERIAKLNERISALEEKVKKSGVELYFQVGTAEKLGSVVRRAETEFVKNNGQGVDGDLEYLTRKARHVMAAQLDAYCIRIALPDGRVVDPPGVSGFLKLLDSLISAESSRMIMTLNKYLDSSRTWADRLDAGFPGGGTDLGDGPLGGAGAADSALLGDPADHDADRRGDRLVG